MRHHLVGQAETSKLGSSRKEYILCLFHRIERCSEHGQQVFLVFQPNADADQMLWYAKFFCPLEFSVVSKDRIGTCECKVGAQ